MTILQNERLGSIVFSPGGVAAAKLAPGPRAADFFYVRCFSVHYGPVLSTLC